MGIFFKNVGQYKASLYETARNLLRSRNTQREHVDRLADENRQQIEAIAKLKNDLHEKETELQQTKELLDKQQAENELLRRQPITLPSDLPLLHHTYGPRMISLCLNLGKRIGFRPTEAALKIVFAWLGIQAKVPTFDSIRGWCCRAGVAQSQMPIVGDDWIWMSDHSNQIGQEKVLQIIGIRACDLPPEGETLPLDRMRVLATVPGKQWTREDVGREYKKLAEQIGGPRFLLTDGATELYESADVLEKEGKKPIVLRDMKHYAANILEKLIGKDERFQTYLSKLGHTRNAVQQTELSHFTPPPQKPKARFMNLGPTLRWGKMVSYHLSHCHSKSRQGITAKRMNDKLGWIKDYREELARWSRCQEVMQASLRFINRQGVYPGCAEKLKAKLDDIRNQQSQPCELSATMASKLIEFVRESESLLEQGQRAWLSTENLESLFGRYKGLERQHSKGGFTGLIAAMPMLLTEWTPARVRESLSGVSVKQMKKWIHDNLGTTLAAKRTTAYKEFALAPDG